MIRMLKMVVIAAALMVLPNWGMAQGPGGNNYPGNRWNNSWNNRWANPTSSSFNNRFNNPWNSGWRNRQTYGNTPWANGSSNPWVGIANNNPWGPYKNWNGAMNGGWNPGYYQNYGPNILVYPGYGY